jgi:hypothetical protein
MVAIAIFWDTILNILFFGLYMASIFTIIVMMALLIYALCKSLEGNNKLLPEKKQDARYCIKSPSRRSAQMRWKIFTWKLLSPKHLQQFWQKHEIGKSFDVASQQNRRPIIHISNTR